MAADRARCLIPPQLRKGEEAGSYPGELCGCDATFSPALCATLPHTSGQYDQQ